MSNPGNVGFHVFDDVEVLDFAGPCEVFNVASESASPPPFYVYAVGISAGIDLALRIVQKLAGPQVDAAVIAEMEYSSPAS